MCSSSFLPTANPIDSPFKVNSYLRLPFVPHQLAKLPSTALKRQQNVKALLLTEAATLTFHALIVTDLQKALIYVITTRLSCFKTSDELTQMIS